MRKLMYVASLGLLTGSMAWAACQGPYCWESKDTGSIEGGVAIDRLTLNPKTSAVILAIVSRQAGELALCNDCTTNGSSSFYELCVSTTALKATAWVMVSSTTRRCQ